MWLVGCSCHAPCQSRQMKLRLPGEKALLSKKTKKKKPKKKKNPRGPLALYRTPECIGYAELEQAWKYMAICCITFTPAEALRSKFDHLIKKLKVNPVSSFEHIWLYLSTQCCIPSFKVIGRLVLKVILEGFYNIWAWTAPWSCDLEHLNTFSSQHHMEAPYGIWLQTA